MRLGISSYAFRWAIGTTQFCPSHSLTPFDLVEETARLGCGVLQIADHSLLDGYTDEQLSALRRRAQERDLLLEVGTSGLTDARLRQYLHIAQALGAPLVRLVLDGPDAHPSLHEARTLLQHLAPLYQEAGVMLAIENHFLLPSPELIRLVEGVGCPAVGVCLDTANSLACQEWPLETIRLLAPYARTVHLKDFRIDPHAEGIGVVISGAPLGKGRQDIPAILDLLHSSCQDVSILLEQWLPYQEDELTTLRLKRVWMEQSLLAARRYLNAHATGSVSANE